MKGPSLKKTAVLSAGLHMMFFLLSFLILKQSHEMVMPSPYVVSLVGPSGKNQDRGTAVESGKGTAIKHSAESAVEKNPAMPHIDEKKELKSIEESIAALKAKRQKEKQLEKIVSLRRAVVSVQGRGVRSTKSLSQSKTAGSAGGTNEAGYTDKIRGQIQTHWEVPDFFRNKDIEAIVSVKIGRDGTLKVEGFEKKSGNRFYDRYVMETIQKASPVSPPPYEMEIGIIFSPKDRIQ